MKRRSQRQELRGPSDRGRRPASSLTRALAAAGMVMLASLAGGMAEAGSPNACRAISKLAIGSCQAEAHGTLLLTEARCNNIADAAAQKACIQAAEAAARDERQSCRDKHGLWKGVCERLGPAPYSPVIDVANFPTSTTIDNHFFPLKPGTTFVYEGQTADGFEHVEFAVTHATRVILGIPCVEVHDVRKVADKVVEDTRDWFAQDVLGNVWYFGENTTLVDNGLALVDGGLPTDLSGTWTGGVDGAQPGFVMEADPAIGDFYRQEFFVGEAEDLAEVKSLTASESVSLTSASCTNECLETEESSTLAPGDVEHKFYKKDVGNILTIDFAADPPERSELVQIITEP
jgi:hypothetical protein